MRARSVSSLVVAITASLLLSGCGETATPTAPQRALAPTPSASNSVVLSSPVNIKALQRNSALTSDITVSKTLGVLGGVIAIPSAGVTIVVPPFALSSTKTISVTARAGSDVAYEFEPHGLRFNLPLVLTQNLQNTQAASGGLINPLNLFVGYFPDAGTPKSVTELLNVGVSIQGQIAVATLWHFSGYIVATGRCEEEE